jgi:hypothetical protein
MKTSSTIIRKSFVRVAFFLGTARQARAAHLVPNQIGTARDRF